MDTKKKDQPVSAKPAKPETPAPPAKPGPQKSDKLQPKPKTGK